MNKEAIAYFEGQKERLEDFRNMYPSPDMVGYQATTKEIGFHELAISALKEPTWQEKLEKEYLFESIKEDMTNLRAENERLLKEIEALKGEWISVSERLPEKDMACLVAVGLLNLTQLAMYSDLMGVIDHRIFYQGDVGHDSFEDITEYVKAWQPLPEPYKKGE